MTGPDPASVRRRVRRLQQRTVDHHVDDPVVQSALAELASVADRVVAEADKVRDAQAAVSAERDRLAAEQHRSQVLFQLAPAACLLTDANGIVQHANPSAVELFEGAGLVGRPLVLRFAREDRARIHAMATSSMRGASEAAVVGLHRAGPERVRTEFRCVRTADDQLLWLGRDVTEQEAARDRLQEAMERERSVAEQLRELDDVRDAFVLAVSHDLQAPLAAIAGLAGLLLEQPRLPAHDRRRMLEQIHSTGERVLVVLRNLLDFERLHRGDIGLERRHVDVATLLTSAASTADFGDRRLVLDTEPTMADVDPVIVRRIIDNLLNNAARHTPPGTTVWALIRREPDGVLLIVEDDGPGVPEHLRSRVFDLFSRDRQAAERGLGAGLALVRLFAELHGGTARVESRPGGGASFHVLLPD